MSEENLVRIDGELVPRSKGRPSSRRRRLADKRHSDPLLHRRPQDCRRLPPLHGRGLRHRPPASPPAPRRFRTACPSSPTPRAGALPPHDVELLLVERNHVCAVCVSNGHCELQTWRTRWASPACASRTATRGCRWTSRTRASCSTTTAASSARAACASAPKSRARTSGRWSRAASTPASSPT